MRIRADITVFEITLIVVAILSYLAYISAVANQWGSVIGYVIACMLSFVAGLFICSHLEGVGIGH